MDSRLRGNDGKQISRRDSSNCNHTTRSVGFAHEPHKYKKVV